MVEDHFFSPGRPTLDKAIAAAAGRSVQELQKDTAAYTSYYYKVVFCKLVHPRKTVAHTMAGLSTTSAAQLDAHVCDVRSEKNKTMKRAVQLAYPGLAAPIEDRTLEDRQAAARELEGEAHPPMPVHPFPKAWRATLIPVSRHRL